MIMWYKWRCVIKYIGSSVTVREDKFGGLGNITLVEKMWRHFITVSCGFFVIISFIVGINSSKCQPGSSQGQCFMYCDSGRCNCDIEAGATSIEKCNQHCSSNATDCPSMMCSGRVKNSSCEQYCSANHGRCKMTCYDVPTCIQECSNGNPGAGCDHIKCDADDCTQSCANCTMECTAEVKKCQQTCGGGKCEAKCSAKECKRDCSRGTCVGVTDSPGTNNSTASHMHLIGDYYSKPLLPTLCLLMKFIY